MILETRNRKDDDRILSLSSLSPNNPLSISNNNVPDQNKNEGGKLWGNPDTALLEVETQLSPLKMTKSEKLNYDIESEVTDTTKAILINYARNISSETETQNQKTSKLLKPTHFMESLINQQLLSSSPVVNKNILKSAKLDLLTKVKIELSIFDSNSDYASNPRSAQKLPPIKNQFASGQDEEDSNKNTTIAGKSSPISGQNTLTPPIVDSLLTADLQDYQGTALRIEDQGHHSNSTIANKLTTNDTKGSKLGDSLDDSGTDFSVVSLPPHFDITQTSNPTKNSKTTTKLSITAPITSLNPSSTPQKNNLGSVYSAQIQGKGTNRLDATTSPMESAVWVHDRKKEYQLDKFVKSILFSTEGPSQHDDRNISKSDTDRLPKNTLKSQHPQLSAILQAHTMKINARQSVGSPGRSPQLSHHPDP